MTLQSKKSRKGRLPDISALIQINGRLEKYGIRFAGSLLCPVDSVGLYYEAHPYTIADFRPHIIRASSRR